MRWSPDLKGQRVTLSPERAEKAMTRRERIAQLTGEGLNAVEIASRLHMRGSYVREVIRSLRGESVEIPAWVPGHLHADYLAIAADDGEEAAASYARNRKRAQISSGSLNCEGR